jgi:hypothetical protein
MRTHIDWLTFTLPMWFSTRADDTYEGSVEFAFVSTFSADTLKTAFGGAWERQERSRAPYTNSWRMPSAGITLFASQSLNHACIEISGQGCERLIQIGEMENVMRATVARITRIDIATDIETSVTPEEFVEKKSHKRMRSDGFQRSETGETFYVGSQKSDRYARVYRYREPHPRAHLLRIEHVFRKEYAKATAKACLESGVNAVAVAAGEAFGWAHEAWNIDAIEHADISIISPNREAGSTINWLITACAPAFKRLVDNGDIRNADEFIARYFLSS